MSDMIRNLDQFSRDVGKNITESLADPAMVEVLEARVTRGIRRRRQVTGALSVTAVAVAATVVTVGLNPWEDLPTPAAPVDRPEIVSSLGSLTVFSDGSMSVVIADGSIVDVPPLDPQQHEPFANPGFDSLCEGVNLDDFKLGWTYAHPDATDLFTFGRPQSVQADGTVEFLAQGSTVTKHEGSLWPAPAFQLEADTSAADHLVFRLQTYVVDSAGEVAVQSALDAAPTITVEGGEGLGGRVAIVQSSTLRSSVRGCGQVAATENIDHYFRRYLVVDVFLADRAGNATYLATHRSMSGIEVTP